MSDFWQLAYRAPFFNRARRALDKVKEVHTANTGSDAEPDLEGILDLVETYCRYYDIMFNDPVFGWNIHDSEMEKYWLFPSQEPKRKTYIQSHIKDDIELSLGVKEARDVLYDLISRVFSPSLLGFTPLLSIPARY